MQLHADERGNGAGTALQKYRNLALKTQDEMSVHVTFNVTDTDTCDLNNKSRINGQQLRCYNSDLIKT